MQDEYRKHIAYLMFHHIKTHPPDDDHEDPGVDASKIQIDTSHIDPIDLNKVKDHWVKVIKPAPPP